MLIVLQLALGVVGGSARVDDFVGLFATAPTAILALLMVVITGVVANTPGCDRFWSAVYDTAAGHRVESAAANAD